MKSNNNPPETYANRVAQFEASLNAKKKAGLEKLTEKLNQLETETTETNPYLKARNDVLKPLSQEKKEFLAHLESTGNTEHPEYLRYVAAIIRQAGDVPSHSLHTNSQNCGCFVCRK